MIDEASLTSEICHCARNALLVNCGVGEAKLLVSNCGVRETNLLVSNCGVVGKQNYLLATVEQTKTLLKGLFEMAEWLV